MAQFLSKLVWYVVDLAHFHMLPDLTGGTIFVQISLECSLAHLCHISIIFGSARGLILLEIFKQLILKAVCSI